MKNTTVSVPDEVDRAARIRAAERGRSVGTLVADHLQSLAESEAVSSRLKAQQKRVQGGGAPLQRTRPS